MKSKLLIALILITVIFSSCKKDDDYSNPDNLAGTEWKSFDKFTFDTEYSIFTFPTKSTVKLYIRYEGGHDAYDEGYGTYSINGTTITFIIFNDTPFTGVIDGNTITLTDKGKVLVFTKM